MREKFQTLNETEGDVADMLYLMLLHGRLLLVSSYSRLLTDVQKLGKPEKALSILIRCVDLSEKYNHRPIYLAGVGLLAKIMNEFGQCEEAYRILSSVMQYVYTFETMLNHRSLRWTIGIYEDCHTLHLPKACYLFLTMITKTFPEYVCFLNMPDKVRRVDECINY